MDNPVLSLSACRLCPRNCSVNRLAGQKGVCGAGEKVRLSRVMLHRWEEPCISGPAFPSIPQPESAAASLSGGSGAVFFAHCSLGCVYCQNGIISRPHTLLPSEKEMDEAALARIFLELQEIGAYNINLVTPTHYAAQIARALQTAKKEGLTLPVVWNTGGYESVPTLAALEGLVDVYLTDFKYASPELAVKLSHAPDYPEAATAALAEMFRQTGKVQLNAQGILQKGVLVRHLVLPGFRKDSLAVLHRVAETVPVEAVRLSLMRQYTPAFMDKNRERYPSSLYRTVTSFEYTTILEEAANLGFIGYSQEKDSASREYTPDFLGPWEI